MLFKLQRKSDSSVVYCLGVHVDDEGRFVVFCYDEEEGKWGYKPIDDYEPIQEG